MRKRFIQALLGLIVVVGLLVGPVAPGAMSRRRGKGVAPGAVLAMSRINGWDHGGSTGS
jgi:hypothetical protein